MKKLLLTALMIMTIFLLTSGVAFAGGISGSLTNNGPGEPTDIHITILDPEATITAASITGPDGTAWSTTISTNELEVGGVTKTCPMATGIGGPVPVGGTVTYDIEADWPHTASWIVEWSYDATTTPANKQEDQAGSYAGLGIDTTVQRSISISIADSMINFGRIKFGDPVTRNTSISISSNDSCSLFVSAEPNLHGSRGNICEFLGVSAAAVGGADTGIGGLMGGASCELISFGDPLTYSWDLDLAVYLEPVPTTRPGYYEGLIEFVAIQAY